MLVCNIGTAENLFGFIDTALGERGIAWSNVAGFEASTTNVMVGKHNSVLSQVRMNQLKVYIAKDASAILPIFACKLESKSYQLM